MREGKRMTCDSCGLEFQYLVGAIIDGIYGQYCNKCVKSMSRQHSAGSAQYSRDRDRDAHEVDMLQPWDAKGTPNTEFIRHYPDEAKDMFTPEELAKYG